MASTHEPAQSTTGAMREERKVVTALFADLVGSTALAERLDPEEVKLVVGEAVARIVREVEALGGHVKDLAGDGVLAFFGAPLASEDDAERAVRAGLRIADELGAYGREVEQAWGIEGLGVRVGLGTGRVVLGSVGGGSRVEYAAFGDTVNLAARLQSAAEPGTVLVDEATARAVAGLFDTGEPVQLELKGKSERVQARTVTGTRGGPVRRRGLAGAEAALVGRDGELAQAADSLNRLRTGTGGVLVLRGEAGIGKSRLLAELARRFADEPVDGAEPVWLEGRCVSYGESLPLWPFRELLRDWLGLSLEEPELRVRVLLRRRLDGLFGARGEEVYPYLASVLGVAPEPEAAARLADLSPEALQYRTFEVVGTLLARLAEDGPVVCAVEDLHWADATSIQLLERLLPLAEQNAVLLVLSLREERDHPCWALKELAAREFPHVFRELALEPLTGNAERELLGSLTGGTLPGELAATILEQAEGNPFFLEELVRSLADAGALVLEDGGWRFDHEVPVEIPETVERVIVARIDRLDPVCHDVLTAAAALGRRFGLQLLEGVVNLDGQVTDALHELQRLDLIRTERRWPQPEYRFKHALIQEAAYRLLLGDAKTALHRRAAEWLECRYADNLDEVVGLLAHHWHAAHDDDQAIAYLTRAADRARQEWSLDEAIDHYRDLLPMLEERGERQAIALALFKLGLALHTALRFREANAAFGRAFGLWEPPAPCESPTATLRASGRIAAQPDPPRSYNLPDIQLQMALFDRLVERWPEATIVPSLAESWEVSPDGLHYLFRLRDGITWSDGTPLTAHDVEYGVKRSLDPERPGVSVAMFYVLENGQDYALGRSDDADAIGVRALDDRTVEFRLVAPAPYFLSLVNRPDAGPQPRHAIERHGDSWTDPGRLVVSGAFEQVERTPERVVLRRRSGRRRGNVGCVELIGMPLDELAPAYAGDEIDLVLWSAPPPLPEGDRVAGAPAGTLYAYFDHRDEVLGNVELRRALACAIDRSALGESLPPVNTVAGGGLVPPALQGHTPDIAPRYDPERAQAHLRASGFEGAVTLAGPRDYERLLASLASSWKRTLGMETAILELSPTDESPAGAIALTGWYPGYPDPEYFLRLLLHSEAADNHGGWSHEPFDELIERARREPDGRRRLELFHEADRVAVADQVALLPLSYFGSIFHVKPRVQGWWEFGKSWSSFGDLVVEDGTS